MHSLSLPLTICVSRDSSDAYKRLGAPGDSDCRNESSEPLRPPDELSCECPGDPDALSALCRSSSKWSALCTRMLILMCLRDVRPVCVAS